MCSQRGRSACGLLARLSEYCISVNITERICSALGPRVSGWPAWTDVGSSRACYTTGLPSPWAQIIAAQHETHGSGFLTQSSRIVSVLNQPRLANLPGPRQLSTSTPALHRPRDGQSPQESDTHITSDRSRQRRERSGSSRERRRASETQGGWDEHIAGGEATSHSRSSRSSRDEHGSSPAGDGPRGGRGRGGDAPRRRGGDPNWQTPPDPGLRRHIRPGAVPQLNDLLTSALSWAELDAALASAPVRAFTPHDVRTAVCCYADVARTAALGAPQALAAAPAAASATQRLVNLLSFAVKGMAPAQLAGCLNSLARLAPHSAPAAAAHGSTHDSAEPLIEPLLSYMEANPQKLHGLSGRPRELAMLCAALRRLRYRGEGVHAAVAVAAGGAVAAGRLAGEDLVGVMMTLQRASIPDLDVLRRAVLAASTKPALAALHSPVLPLTLLNCAALCGLADKQVLDRISGRLLQLLQSPIGPVPGQQGRGAAGAGAWVRGDAGAQGGGGGQALSARSVMVLLRSCTQLGYGSNTALVSLLEAAVRERSGALDALSRLQAAVRLHQLDVDLGGLVGPAEPPPAQPAAEPAAEAAPAADSPSPAALPTALQGGGAGGEGRTAPAAGAEAQGGTERARPPAAAAAAPAAGQAAAVRGPLVTEAEVVAFLSRPELTASELVAALQVLLLPRQATHAPAGGAPSAALPPAPPANSQPAAPSPAAAGASAASPSAPTSLAPTPAAALPTPHLPLLLAMPAALSAALRLLPDAVHVLSPLHAAAVLDALAAARRPPPPALLARAQALAVAAEAKVAAQAAARGEGREGKEAAVQGGAGEGEATVEAGRDGEVAGVMAVAALYAAAGRAMGVDPGAAREAGLEAGFVARCAAAAAGVEQA